MLNFKNNCNKNDFLIYNIRNTISKCNFISESIKEKTRSKEF